MDTMQWDDVRYFLALARQGSLSATARSLQVEHTTVARRVTGLEQALQVKLFDRLPRGWVLTPEGLQLFEQARFLEEEMMSLQRAALNRSSLAGRIRLSVPPLLMNFFLLPHLGKFRSMYPEIDLELIGERRTTNMMGGEADIALRIKEPDEPGLIARPLAEIHYGLYGTAQCLATAEPQQSFIGFDNSIPDLPQKRWLDEHVGSRHYTLLTNDMMTMYQAALHHWGIAFLPRILGETDRRLHLTPEPLPPTRSIYLVMHPDVRRAPRIRAMADFIVHIFQAHQDEL